MFISCSDTYLLKVTADISLKIATSGSFKEEKPKNFSFLGLLF